MAWGVSEIYDDVLETQSLCLMPPLVEGLYCRNFVMPFGLRKTKMMTLLRCENVAVCILSDGRTELNDFKSHINIVCQDVDAMKIRFSFRLHFLFYDYIKLKLCYYAQDIMDYVRVGYNCV